MEPQISPEAVDRERAMLVKEADWIRQDITDAWNETQRIRTVSLGVTVAVFGWIVSRAIEPGATVLNPDEQIWALRQRGDFALALFILVIIHTALGLASTQALSVWAALNVELIRRGQAMSILTRWNWRFYINNERYVQIPTYAFIAYVSTLYLGLVAGACWFFDPASVGSSIVWTMRAVALACSLVSTIGSVVYGFRLSRMIDKHVERPWGH